VPRSVSQLSCFCSNSLASANENVRFISLETPLCFDFADVLSIPVGSAKTECLFQLYLYAEPTFLFSSVIT